MNAIRSLSRRTLQLRHQQRLSGVFWGCSLVFGGVLVAVLYCLLTRDIPIRSAGPSA